MFGVRRVSIHVTGGNCTLPAIRIWQTTPLTTPSQRLIHTNPRSAACAISTAQDYLPNVWSNSSSGIGSASTPASCNHRSCPASALRFAVWSNSSSGIASNTASGAASSCPIFISSGGERAGAIDILYWEGKITLIDFPQATDALANRNARKILNRDIQRVCEYFEQYGVQCNANAITAKLWERYAAPDPLNYLADMSRVEAERDEDEQLKEELAER